MPSVAKREGTNNSQIKTLRETFVHIKIQILTGRICIVNVKPAKTTAYS